jgi:hypothetical protein
VSGGHRQTEDTTLGHVGAGLEHLGQGIGEVGH